MEVQKKTARNKRNPPEDKQIPKDLLPSPKKTQTEKTKEKKFLGNFEKEIRNMTVRVSDEFKTLMSWGVQSYSFDLDHQPTIFEIDRNLICYHSLDRERFGGEGGKIQIKKNCEKMEKIIKKIVNGLLLTEQVLLYVRGSSGVGKTYSLIFSSLWIKKNFSDQLRIVHVILSCQYFYNFSGNFLKDLMYAFSIDKEQKFGPLPDGSLKEATLKDWYLYLKKKPDDLAYDSFLEEMNSFYESKGIKMVMIWDGDNFYHKCVKLQTPRGMFISQMRDGARFSFVVQCASDNDELYKNLRDNAQDDNILQFNQGFTEEETFAFLNDEKTKGIMGFTLSKIEVNELYEVTYGNCLLLKKFIETPSQNRTFQSKYQSFFEQAQQDCEVKVEHCFNEKIHITQVNNESFKENFGKLLIYLDKEIPIPKKFYPDVDRNNMFLENKGGYKILKSVSLISRQEILKFYSFKMFQKNVDDQVKMLLINNLKSEKDGAVKGKFFERYVLLCLQQKLKNLGTNEELIFFYDTNLTSNNSKKLALNFKPGDNCKYFSCKEELLQIVEKGENVIAIPSSTTNADFDFLVLQFSPQELLIYPCHISINIAGHDASDKIFYKKNVIRKYIENSINPNSITIYWQFVWINGDPQYCEEQFFKAKQKNKLKFETDSWFCNFPDQIWTYF